MTFKGHFLHGELEVDVQEARDLPDTDNFMCNIKNCVGHEKDVTDPYVAVCLDNTRIITTSVREKYFTYLLLTSIKIGKLFSKYRLI